MNKIKMKGGMYIFTLITLLSIVICLPITASATVVGYSVTAQAQALSNQDPNTVTVGGTFTGSTSENFDTGEQSNGGGLTGTGQAYAYADLGTGKLKGSGTVTGSGFAGVNLGFQDYLSFVLPTGMTQADIGFSMYVHGTATGLTSAFASISLGHASSSSGHAGPGSGVLGQTYSGVFSITQDTDAFITSVLNFSVFGTGEFNLLNTATVTLDLPDRVTFTSESGVFLTQQDATVPEPASLALMGLGLAVIGYRRKKAK